MRGHTHYCSGVSQYSRQCTSCKHTDLPTAGTLFHKVKFPLVKAFYIVHFVATSKKGIASTKLSRKLGFGQKTCCYFKCKVIWAMKSIDKYPLMGKVEVNGFFVGGQDTGKKGVAKRTKSWLFWQSKGTTEA